MFRIADPLVHEVTDQVTGRKVCINAGDVIAIHQVDGGKAGIQQRGHNGVTVSVEPYETVRDLFFPTLEEFNRRKIAAEARERARWEASAKAYRDTRAELTADLAAAKDESK